MKALFGLLGFFSYNSLFVSLFLSTSFYFIFPFIQSPFFHSPALCSPVFGGRGVTTHMCRVGSCLRQSTLAEHAPRAP